MFEGLFQPTHLILILAIVLIIFGPGKMAGIGKTLGSSIREFRESVDPSAPTAVATAPAAPAAPVTAPTVVLPAIAVSETAVPAGEPQ